MFPLKNLARKGLIEAETGVFAWVELQALKASSI